MKIIIAFLIFFTSAIVHAQTPYTISPDPKTGGKVYKGVINKESLLKEKITEDELEAVVREHGVLSSADVELAVLERDGNISVVSKDLSGQTFHKRSRMLHPRHQKAD